MPEYQGVIGTSWKFCLASVEEWFRMNVVQEGTVSTDAENSEHETSFSVFYV